MLTAKTRTPGRGTVRLGPTLDVEAPITSSQCDATAAFTTRLTTADGALFIAERGPRLCLGATGAVKRSFRVAGGSGRYAGASGAGTATIDVLSVGAGESWRGRIALR
jgi:hypothetical protein